MLTQFIARMLPEKRQFLNSTILCLMGATVIWGAGHVSHTSLHWVVQTGGLFLIYSGVSPLIARPVSTVTDLIAEAILVTTQPLRKRAKARAKEPQEWWQYPMGEGLLVYYQQEADYQHARRKAVFALLLGALVVLVGGIGWVSFALILT